MGDFDNNPVNSSTFASYEDPNLGISIDTGTSVSIPEEPAVDLSSLSSGTSSGDSFSKPLRLPRHLSPHASIRISDENGGTRTLELIDLIREARSNPASRQQLMTLASAAASDPGLLNQCYVSREENLLPMLAQLGSSDPVARREGALSLRHFILSHPEDRTLQQGLLATVADVARNDRDNVEARELLVAVSRDASPQNAGLRNWMQGQSQISPYCSQSSTSTPINSSSSSPVATGGGATPLTRNLSANDPNSIVAVANSLLPGRTQTGAVAPIALSANASQQIVAMIEHRTAGTPLEGVPTEGIVGFVQQHAGLPAGTFEDLLRLRILADSLPLNGFTGNLFGTSTSVATLLAEDIRRVINREDSAVGALPVGNEVNRLASGSVDANAGSPLSAPAADHPPVLVAHAPAAVPNSLGNGGNASNALSFFVPALLTSLSGMQGLSSNPSSLGPTPLATLAMGLSGRSSYHVDGPTSIDEDSHQGFGGGSQGGDSGHEGGEGRDERREGSDAYLA